MISSRTTLVCLISIFLFNVSIQVTKVKAAALPTLIIHQIRGSEGCCQPGAPEMVTTINAVERVKDLPLAWALRYDAIKDSTYTETVQDLPESQVLGILLEVTPELASASGVLYKGDTRGGEWYQARNSQLVGYTKAERKKLIDTVFTAFKDQFTTEPTFTVSWMIDAWSLAYLRETYDIRVHEITKEQYEIDTYTLEGGIFNLPYIPIRTHPLLPARFTADQLDLMMIRQTISDVDRNYSSKESYFTSQPNDYLANPHGSGFAYFEGLIKEVASQDIKQQFALLGLENSEEWNVYKEEYLHQLIFIAEKEAEGFIATITPYNYYAQNSGELKTQKSHYLKSATFPESGALWYFGRDYRARVESVGGELVLTDWRVYSLWTDPYKDTPVHTSQAYWIVPYVIDSSLQGIVGDDAQGHKKPFGISLIPAHGTTISFAEDELKLETDNQTVRFDPSSLLIEGSSDPQFTSPIDLSVTELLRINTPQYFTFSKHPRFVITPDKNAGQIRMGWETKELQPTYITTMMQTEKGWKLSPNTTLNQTDINSLNAIYQPDRSEYAFNPGSSTFFWHNTEAIAGRSAVRLYIDPRNVLGRTVSVTDFTARFNPENNIQILKPPTLNVILEPFFVDFVASESAASQVSVSIDGNIIEDKAQVRFYTNCIKNSLPCLHNSEELIGFTKVMLRDTYQESKNKIRQISSRLFSKFLKNINNVRLN